MKQRINVSVIYVDHGSERSSGAVEMVVTIENVGVLTYKCVFGSSGANEPEDYIIKLNGKEIGIRSCPDLRIPHWHAGQRMIKTFQENKQQWLTEDISAWLEAEELDGGQVMDKQLKQELIEAVDSGVIDSNIFCEWEQDVDDASWHFSAEGDVLFVHKMDDDGEIKDEPDLKLKINLTFTEMEKS